MATSRRTLRRSSKKASRPRKTQKARRTRKLSAVKRTGGGGCKAVFEQYLAGEPLTVAERMRLKWCKATDSKTLWGMARQHSSVDRRSKSLSLYRSRRKISDS